MTLLLGHDPDGDGAGSAVCRSRSGFCRRVNKISNSRVSLAKQQHTECGTLASGLRRVGRRGAPDRDCVAHGVGAPARPAASAARASDLRSKAVASPFSTPGPPLASNATRVSPVKASSSTTEQFHLVAPTAASRPARLPRHPPTVAVRLHRTQEHRSGQGPSGRRLPDTTHSADDPPKRIQRRTRADLFNHTSRRSAIAFGTMPPRRRTTRLRPVMSLDALAR